MVYESGTVTARDFNVPSQQTGVVLEAQRFSDEKRKKTTPQTEIAILIILEDILTQRRLHTACSSVVRLAK